MIAILVERIGSPWLGVVLPAIVLFLSFWIAWALFKRFTKD